MKKNNADFRLIDADPISSADLLKKNSLIAKNMSDVFFLLRIQQLSGNNNVFIKFKTKAIAKKAISELKWLGYTTNVYDGSLDTGIVQVLDVDWS